MAKGISNDEAEHPNFWGLVTTFTLSVYLVLSV
jgi:hypothetical protein